MIAHLLITLLMFFFFNASAAFAETKTITAEATYIMGDGETPSFAEAMALQKAKQMALEQAGTYVESYTKVQNLRLTTEEIQTIAGGVLQVEVLKKTRTLVGDAMRCYTKIKAIVTTDKMEELASRIKGKNVAEEYTKLQAEYARLSLELENQKQRAAKIPQGREREAALDQIREGEKAFARIQQRETEFFQRLVSGKQLVEQASSDKEVVDELLKTIVTRGYVVTVGEVKAATVPREPDILALNVPLTIRVSEALHEAVSQAASALGGTMRSDVEVSLRTDFHAPLRIGTDTRSNAKVTLVRLGKYLDTARYFQDRVMKLALLVTFLDGTSEPSYCFLMPWGQPPSPLNFRYLPGEDEWFAVRRMFPVSEVRLSGKTFGNNVHRESIDNGAYDETIACEEDVNVNCRFPKLKDRMKETRQDIPGRNGYVAIVRDEATFVVQHKLPAQSVKNLTGVNVRVLSLTAQDKTDANKCLIVQ